MAGPAVKVTVSVTVEMSEAQRDRYADEFGVGLVAPDVKGRIGNDITGALGAVYWLGEFATVTVSTPVLRKG